MEKEIKKGKSGAAKAIVLGTSLAGLAASAYFLFTEKGKKNQKYAKAWAIKMKGDVVEKLESAREVSEPVYHKIIDSVAAKHEKIKKDGPKEVKELANDLKKHWSTISSMATAKPEIKKPTVKKIVKKAKPVKKVIKKK
jgi:hypothetical protein